MCSFTILFLLGQGVVAAEDGGTPIKFSGIVRYDNQYDGIDGKDQGRPKWIRTLVLNPSLSIFGYALDFPLTFSTLESEIRQPFNRFNLHIGRDWSELDTLGTYKNLSRYAPSGTLLR
ncbi:hypothetical protein IIA15_11875, partial [candidate division TA06 bacterium]|nr:hypothetical protein [candidate division TA06 bacterium]